MQRNAFSPFIDQPPRRSGVEELASLLCEAHVWRMRLMELTIASFIFFALGFAIAVRCL